jgi:hypothetical protein
MGDTAAVTLDEMAAQVVDAAFKVHTALGPGLLESAYEQCMRYELMRRQVPFEVQVTLPVTHDGTQIDAGFRADLLVGQGRHQTNGPLDVSVCLVPLVVKKCF